MTTENATYAVARTVSGKYVHIKLGASSARSLCGVRAPWVLAKDLTAAQSQEKATCTSCTGIYAK